MKITETQLRKIISRIVKESTGEVTEVVDDRNFHHLEVGNTYQIDGMPGVNEFVGWFLENSNTPTGVEVPPEQTVLRFRDVRDGDTWDAYFDDGRFCWGSSADELIVTETSSM